MSNGGEGRNEVRGPEGGQRPDRKRGTRHGGGKAPAGVLRAIGHEAEPRRDRHGTSRHARAGHHLEERPQTEAARAHEATALAMFVVDDINQAIEDNRFDKAGELFFESPELQMLPDAERRRICSPIVESVRGHAKTLLTEKEPTKKTGKQFVECVSWFHDELQGQLTVPHELSSEITEAITEHLTTTFKDSEPEDSIGEFTKFKKLSLLTEAIRQETQELKTAMAEKSRTYFDNQDAQSVVDLWNAYLIFTGKKFQPADDETRRELGSNAVAMLDEEFANWDELSQVKSPREEEREAQDPRLPLALLDAFVNDLQYVSVAEVKKHPELLQRVRAALRVSHTVSGSLIPESREKLNRVYKQFSDKVFLRDLRSPF